ncbi:BRCT domain-containing protein, partial [Glonium stellatum]
MLDDGDLGKAQTPLAGVVLCCTSIPPEQRTELAAVAVQMGAVHKYDLTSDVTHLIVGNIDTPKYKYVAKERPDVKVLTPQWLEAIRLSWIGGGDTDVAALEEEHRVPTFQGLRICVTGFDDLVQRQYISDTVEKHGAAYHGDLTKSVTHLMAAAPGGKKYEYARNWGVKIVALEWFQDSIERGMVLEEKCYDPIIPKEERGKGAWNRAAISTVALGKRGRVLDRVAPAIDANPKRKLRRTASTKLGSQNGSIWADITAGGPPTKNDESDDWNNQVDESFVDKSIITLDKSGLSKDSAATTEQTTEGHPAANPTDRILGLPLRRYEGIFEGRVVFVHGFDGAKSAILQEHLTSNGAAVVRTTAELEQESSDGLEHGFLIVPHDVASTELPVVPEPASKLCRVTNWWVEKCLHRKGLVDPVGEVLCRPFKRLGINGFSGMIIGSTSFAGVELLHVSKVVKLMGATYDEYLTPTTSVLVCNSKTPNKEKLNYAVERNIPAVSAEWLWESLRTGEKQPFQDYLLIKPREKRTDGAKQFFEVPTAPLSEEDSAKLRNRKQQQTSEKAQQATKQPQKDKDRHRRAPTLELIPSNEPPPTSTAHNDSTDSNDLDTPTFAFDNPASITAPLQELAPEVNSPRRPSNTSVHSASSGSTVDSTAKPIPISEPAVSEKRSRQPTPDSANLPEPPESLTTTIANLLAQKQAASAAPPAESNQRRRKRGL